MTKYNSLSEYMQDVFLDTKTYEEAMIDFNVEVAKIKNLMRLPINLYLLKTLINVIQEQIENHHKAYPNRTPIMLEQENILNDLMGEIEKKITEIEADDKN